MSINTKDIKTEDIKTENIKTKVIKSKRTSKNSIKDKVFLEHILKNPKATLKEAVIASGFPPSYVNEPNKIMNRPSFIEHLDKAGLTDEKLSELAMEGLGANRPIVIKNEIVDYPDYSARHKFFDTVLKAKRHLQPDNQFNTQINDYKVIIEE